MLLCVGGREGLPLFLGILSLGSRCQSHGGLVIAKQK